MVKIKSWKPPQDSLVKLPCRLKPPGCFIQPNSLEKTTGNDPPAVRSPKPAGTRQALLSLRSPELGFQFSSTKATSVTLGLWKFIYQKLTHHKFRAQSKKKIDQTKNIGVLFGDFLRGYPLKGIILQWTKVSTSKSHQHVRLHHGTSLVPHLPLRPWGHSIISLFSFTLKLTLVAACWLTWKLVKRASNSEQIKLGKNEKKKKKTKCCQNTIDPSADRLQTPQAANFHVDFDWKLQAFPWCLTF